MSAQYALSPADIECIRKNSLNEFIFSQLMRKKYRKWAIDESAETQIKNAIRIQIAKKEPIRIVYPFGGYKLWRMPSSPHVDWAEFFAISHILSYIAPISAGYKPGVEIEFTSDEVIVETMNNISKADLEVYTNEFRTLLMAFEKYCPNNVSLKLTLVRDLYVNTSELEKDINQNMPIFTSQFESEPPEKQQARLVTSELNINFAGDKDLTKLNTTQKEKFIKNSAILHHAYCKIPKRSALNRSKDKVLIFTTLLPNSIPIGTTKASITKFWTGFGVLEKVGNNYRPLVLSPKNIEDLDYRTEKVDCVDLPMFSKIYIC